MDKESNLLRTAFDNYLAQLSGDSLEPSDNYLLYDFQLGAVSARPAVLRTIPKCFGCRNERYASRPASDSGNELNT